MPLSNMGKIKDYFQPLNNLVVSPPAPQFEGKRIPLILSPVESQCDISVANLPSTITKNEDLDVSEDPVLFDSMSGLKKNKGAEGSKESIESPPSPDAHNFQSRVLNLLYPIIKRRFMRRVLNYLCLMMNPRVFLMLT